MSDSKLKHLRSSSINYSSMAALTAEEQAAKIKANRAKIKADKKQMEKELALAEQDSKPKR